MPHATHDHRRPTPHEEALRLSREAEEEIRNLHQQEAFALMMGRLEEARRIFFRREHVWRPRLMEAEARIDAMRANFTTFEGQEDVA